jgi:hypothetical protein
LRIWISLSFRSKISIFLEEICGDLEMLMQSQCVYTTQTVTVHGMQAQINELLVNGIPVMSGVISINTKWIFRSRSAKLTWLIQLSEEMWNIADDGNVF